jgi:hypothetical protein
MHRYSCHAVFFQGCQPDLSPNVRSCECRLFHKTFSGQLGYIPSSYCICFDSLCLLPLVSPKLAVCPFALSALGDRYFRIREAVSVPPFPRTRCPPLDANKLLVLILTIMSHTHAAAASSSNQASNFQVIFNNALKAYERRTKKDLLAHPLAAQLQSCNSPSGILIVLQQQVQELNQSQSSDERLTKWLDPTVNVLYTLSGTLGEGVNLVCPVISKCPRSVFSYLFYRYSRPRKRFLPELVSSFRCVSFSMPSFGPS